MKCIVVHYSEIGIKGQNRGFFERQLIENIKNHTGGKVKRQRGRLIVLSAKKPDALSRMAGVAYYSAAEEVPLEMARIKKAVVAASRGKAKTFRITASRSNKLFRYNSIQLNRMLGGAVRKKADLHNPELEIFVEIADKAYIYTKKIPGVEGLPVGTAGRLVCLLSGGIDSPLAAYRMMTRGCKIIFIHFHNYDPFPGKIKKLVKILSQYQGRSKLYMVPFKEVQQGIIKKTMKTPQFRMLLYRRMMMQIAEQIAKEEKALGLVTGDSVAQVASQTLQNLNVIYDPVELPVFSPLIGTSKKEIVDEAKRIGTYETSIKPYSDCCSVLVGKHPETRGNIIEMRKLEKKLKIGALVKKAMKKAEVEKI